MPDPRDRGTGLIGLLFVLLVLGVAGAAALISLNGGTTGSGSIPHVPSITTPSGQFGVASDISAAAIAACQANYSAASQTITLYQAEHGQLPTTNAEVQSYLKDPLSTKRFSISIDGAHPGQLQVSVPGHPVSDGPSNCAFAGG